MVLVSPMFPVFAAQNIPPIVFEGTLPCGNEGAKDWYEKWFPKLEEVMGQPFTIGSEKIIWKWDTSGRTSHGWDASTNTVWFTPSDIKSCDLKDGQNMYRSYFREVAHLFYDLGVKDLNFGPQWLRQMNVGYALASIGEEPTNFDLQTDIYDRFVFPGPNKVNGVLYNGSKYGDSLGSHGRSWVDASSTIAFTILSQVFGDDLLKKVNQEIYNDWKATANSDMLPATYASILNKVTQGKTIDGKRAGDWLLEQSFTNTVGDVGNFVVISPRGINSDVSVALYRRQINSVDNRTYETPIVGGKVTLKLISNSGDTIATQELSIPDTGETDAYVASQSTRDQLALGAYLLRATTAEGLSDFNIYLSGIKVQANQILFVAMNSDGTAIDSKIVESLGLIGAKEVCSLAKGLVVAEGEKSTSIKVRIGTWSSEYNVLPNGRVVLLKIPVQEKLINTDTYAQCKGIGTSAPTPGPSPTNSQNKQQASQGSANSSMETIVCVKGAEIATITAPSPICPSGFEKKSPSSTTTLSPTPNVPLENVPVIQPSLKPTVLPTIQATPIQTIKSNPSASETIKTFPTPSVTTLTKKSQPTTIMCFKGKLTKKVTGTNPKCPTGYTKN